MRIWSPLIKQVSSNILTITLDSTKFVRAAQRLHEQGICHNQLLEGNIVVGLRMSDNFRVRVNAILKTTEVLFVNFEKATKHRGFSCPSVGNEFISKGCKELDDIYEYSNFARESLLKEREKNQIDDVYADWDTGSATSISL